MAGRGSKPGEHRGGRKPGIPNKFTKQFKDLLSETYQALEKKEGFGLQTWAEKHPTDFYRICSKLVPTEITHDIPEGKKFSLIIE